MSPAAMVGTMVDTMVGETPTSVMDVSALISRALPVHLVWRFSHVASIVSFFFTRASSPNPTTAVQYHAGSATPPCSFPLSPNLSTLFARCSSVGSLFQPPFWAAAYQDSSGESTLACLSSGNADLVDPSETPWYCEFNTCHGAHVSAKQWVGV